MGGLKEIRRRITSVKNTKQITKAMKLVAAAKLRRAQESAINGRAYREELNRVLGTLSSSIKGDLPHPLLELREDPKVRRVIAISGDRGLCGAYNANVIKAIEASEIDDNLELEFVPIGRKTVSAINSVGLNVVAAYEGLSDDVSTWPIAEIVNNFINDFEEGKCDEVVLYYTKFVSALSLRVTREKLLPFSVEIQNVARPQDDEITTTEGSMTTSPDPETILTGLIPILLRTQLRQASFEAKASEQSARMTAMDSATKNAEDLIEQLTLYYNRARQSAITTELIDIVGGAEAIN